MWNIEFTSLRKFASHFFVILLIFLALVLLRYPIFLNSDYFFLADEALFASHILDLLNGDQFILYYPSGRTFGLTFGIVCAPFIWVLGPTALAYNLPAALFYSLYLWTTYLIARTLIPRTAYLVFILLFFTPYFLTELTTHNWAHVPAAFLGNLIFLLFIKAKLSKRSSGGLIFSLFFAMGLAIYTYTYSLLYISTIGILYVLSHPRWKQVREKISFITLVGFFKDKRTKMETFCQLLDILIFLFFVAVIFSYIFGGFGLDIAGHSILQINEFNKAAMQLLGLIFLRILITPKGSISFLRGAKSYLVDGIESGKKQLVVMGVMGFLIGLSPRIASILIGETSRGGQGHDIDLLPTKLLAHTHGVLTQTGPQLFGLDFSSGSNLQYLVSNTIDIFWIILCFLFMSLIAIFFFSTASFISKNWTPLKNIMTLRGMQFEPVHVILLAPILVCIANIIVQHGSETRYLFPLFGIVVLWVGIYVDKVKEKAKWFPVIVLAVWVSFYSISNYRNFTNSGIIEGVKTVKFDRHPIYDVIEFLEEEGISVAYAGHDVASKVSYLSDGKIYLNEYSLNPTFKTYRRAIAMASPHFAIIAQGDHLLTYKNYLQEKRIEFKTATVAGYKILRDFTGSEEAINNLRYLIPEGQPVQINSRRTTS